ncbi:hypothetical protein HY468_01685 [Candidatus Roizmanbacteria bacterium]|nr:hypothetical protein [Candidatus Roizmanbacteria bacterium]
MIEGDATIARYNRKIEMTGWEVDVDRVHHSLHGKTPHGRQLKVEYDLIHYGRKHRETIVTWQTDEEFRQMQRENPDVPMRSSPLSPADQETVITRESVEHGIDNVVFPQSTPIEAAESERSERW